MKQALLTGTTIDAAVSSDLRSTENEWIIAKFDASPYYIIVKKGNAELLEEVNEAIFTLNSNNPSLSSSLYKKYYTVSHEQIYFTKEEIEYINSLKLSGTKISVAVKPNRMPFSGYNEQGEIVGIIGDIMNYAAEKTGLSFEPIVVSTRAEYNTLLAENKVEAVFDSAVYLNNSNNISYKSTTDYMTLKFAQLIKKNNLKKENLTIAAAKSEAVTSEYIEKNFKEENIIYYDDIKSCINAVLTDEADCMLIDVYTAKKVAFDDYTAKTTYRNFPYYSKDVSFSVSTDQNPLLFSILNKVAANLDNATIQEFVNTEVDNKTQNTTLLGFLYAQPVMSVIITIAFILLIVVSYYFINLNKNKKQQEKIMNEYTRFIDYVCQAYDEVVEINLSEKRRYKCSVENGVFKRIVVPYITPEFLISVIHPEDYNTISEIIAPDKLKKLLNNQSEAYAECRVLENGKYRWYSYTFKAIKLGEKVSQNSLIYFKKDIEETKQNETKHRVQLYDALVGAQSANEAKSVFLSKMSHEIRTPLNAILGYMALSKGCLDDAEKTGEYLKKSEFASKHLLSLINDILDLSSIESGKMKISDESFNLSSLLSSIATLYSNQAAEKNVEFVTDFARISDYRIFGDKMRINQIILNLLSNALKFTPKGGKITFSVEQVKQVKDDILFRFTVSDTGIGMEKKFLDKLFEPFEQQDSSIAQRFGGTGLGLSITKNLVQLMNGTISVQSKINKGSTFIVELPLKPDSEYDLNEEINEYYENTQYDFTGKKILVAEDNEMNREIVSEILKSVNLSITVVNNGQEAVNDYMKSESGYYDFILMDVQMPIMNGYDASKAIRSSDRADAKTIPIIAMTANAFAEDISASLAAGMNEHISKPIDIKMLFATLASFIKD